MHPKNYHPFLYPTYTHPFLSHPLNFRINLTNSHLEDFSSRGEVQLPAQCMVLPIGVIFISEASFILCLGFSVVT